MPARKKKTRKKAKTVRRATKKVTAKKKKVRTKPRSKTTAKGKKKATSKGTQKIRKADWAVLAQDRIPQILSICRDLPELKKLTPKVPLLHVDVKMVDQPKMVELNEYYKGKASPTDILSFPGPEPFYTMGFLGELVICEPVLRKQAREIRIDTEVELLVLLVHGVLHLLGLDHERTKEEARLMEQLEKLILKATLPPALKKQAAMVKSLIERNR